MSTPLETLIAHAPELIEAEPVWGWYLARACRAGRLGSSSLPPVLAPFVRLAALETGAPDPAELSAALDAAAKTSGAQDGRAILLWEAGFLLPGPWAFALDELAAEAPPIAPNPRFLDLARLDVDRATRRVERAFAVGGIFSSVSARLLYEALIACHDARVAVPDALHACRARLEAADPGSVDEAERFSGRLRLGAREVERAAGPPYRGQASDDVLRLATEAVHQVGADDVYFGLWSVLARVPGAAAHAPRWIEVLPRTPTPEVILSLLARVGAADAGQVAAQSSKLAQALTAGTENGRRGWPAAWRLLGAAVALGAPRAVEAILPLGPPRWAVEIATYRELRAAPASLRDRIVAHLREPEREDAPLDWRPPPPPWAWLSGEVFAARLSLLADPDMGLPNGFPWGDGNP